MTWSGALLFDHYSCFDLWKSRIASWQEVLGKDVFNAEMKEAVAEVVLFSPSSSFAFGTRATSSWQTSSSRRRRKWLQSASPLRFSISKIKFHKWLYYMLNREGGMVGGVSSWQRRNPRAGINIVFTFRFVHPKKKLENNLKKTCSLHTSFYFSPEDGDPPTRLKIGFSNWFSYNKKHRHRRNVTSHHSFSLLWLVLLL